MSDLTDLLKTLIGGDEFKKQFSSISEKSLIECATRSADMFGNPALVNDFVGLFKSTTQILESGDFEGAANLSKTLKDDAPFQRIVEGMKKLLDHTVVRSCDVRDKISGILVCQMVPGTISEKTGRTGEKYLASSVINPELLAFLKAGIRYKVTGKLDGSCALIYGGRLLKRRDIKPGKDIPVDWMQTGATGVSVATPQDHLIGYMPLDKGDKWHIDCHAKVPGGYDLSIIRVLDLNADSSGLEYKEIPIAMLESHSVEVMGPMFQSNPHELKSHCVMRHGIIEIKDFPNLMNYLDDSSDLLDQIKRWFSESDVLVLAKYLEGVVLHLDNGKMFKIHRHHLDMQWNGVMDVMDAMGAMSLEDISL